MAASARDIRAGGAFVELYAKNSALLKGLAQAQRRLRDFGNGIALVGKWMMGLGTAIVAPVLAATKHFASVGNQLDKLATKLGISTNAFSELSFAAEQTGVSQNTLAMAMQRMVRRVSEAARGTGEATDALKELGLDARELAGMAPDQALARIAGAMQHVERQSDRVRLAFKLFDSEGVALVNMLARGEAGLASLRKEARDLGLSIDPEQAKAAADLTDALNRMKRAVGAAVVEIGSAFAPMLIRASEAIKRVTVGAGKWISENRQIITTVVKVAAGVAAAGVGVLIFGKTIVGLGAILGGLHGFIMWAAGGVQMLISVLGLAVSPALAIGVAITAAGAALIYLARNTAPVKAVAASLGEFFGGVRSMVSTVVSDVTTAWGGIADALAAGDIGGAVKVVTATIKLEWARVTTWLQETWQGFLIVWSNITTSIAGFMIEAVAAIKVVWASAMGWLTKTWEAWKVSTFEEGLADWLAPIMSKFLGVDTEELRKTMREDFARGREALPQKQRDIDAQTAREKTRIETSRRQQQKNLAEDKRRSDEARGARIAGLQKELDEAVKARDAAVAAAGESRRKAEAGRSGDAAKPAFSPPQIDLPGLQAAKVTMGTFSAAQAALWGGGRNVQTEILTETQKQTEEVRRLIKVDEKIVEAIGKPLTATG